MPASSGGQRTCENNDLRAPAVTINEFASHVDAVAGLETTRRFATRYMPRVPEETAAMVGEAMNIAAQQILSECYAEHSISEAFSDCLVTGGMVLAQHRSTRTPQEDRGALRRSAFDQGRPDGGKAWGLVVGVRDGTMIPEAIAAEFGVDVDEVKGSGRWREEAAGYGRVGGGDADQVRARATRPTAG